MKRSLSRNTAYLLIGNLGGTALAFLLSLLIGRSLGVEALGLYSAVLAWVFSLSMLLDFGLSSLFTRDLAQKPEAIPSYLQTGMRQRWFFGIVLLAICFFAASFMSKNPSFVWGLRISAPLLLIENIFGLYTAIFRARSRMFPIASLNIGMLIVQLGLSALFIQQGILALLWINTLTSLGRLGVAWYLSRYPESETTLPLIPMLKLAWPFALAGLLAVAQQRMGILMLENLSNLEQAGNYAAVSRFIEAGRMIPNAFFGALFPVLASLAADSDRLKTNFLRVLLGLSVYALVIALFGGIFTVPIISLSYGEAFLGAESLLRLGIISLLPSLLRAAKTLHAYAEGRENFVNFVNFLLLFLQFALSFWLIPSLGALALVLAIMFTETLGLVLLYLPKKRVK